MQWIATHKPTLDIGSGASPPRRLTTNHFNVMVKIKFIETLSVAEFKAKKGVDKGKKLWYIAVTAMKRMPSAASALPREPPAGVRGRGSRVKLPLGAAA